MVIGLTGGIACGKSTVASLLRQRGAEIVSADEIAREIVAPGTEAHDEIARTFGPEILHPDGTVDRARLRRKIFADESARKKLEAITHPRIRERALERLREAAQRGARLVVYEAPLLFENRVHLWLRPVVLVACDRETQLARLAARDGLAREEAERHLAAQLPLEEKRRLADFVIENSGSLEELARKVEALWQQILPGQAQP
jgi:dephospho-CoA kinase